MLDGPATVGWSSSRSQSGAAARIRSVPAPRAARVRAFLGVRRASPRCNTRRRMPTAAILTIGNELTSGNVPNSNAAWLAKRLEPAGVKVVIAASLPDEIVAVARFLRRE